MHFACISISISSELNRWTVDAFVPSKNGSPLFINPMNGSFSFPNYALHTDTHTRHGTEMPLAHSAFEKERNERVPMCNAVRSPSDGRQYFLLCIHHTILM